MTLAAFVIMISMDRSVIFLARWIHVRRMVAAWTRKSLSGSVNVSMRGQGPRVMSALPETQERVVTYSVTLLEIATVAAGPPGQTRLNVSVYLNLRVHVVENAQRG